MGNGWRARIALSRPPFRSPRCLDASSRVPFRFGYDLALPAPTAPTVERMAVAPSAQRLRPLTLALALALAAIVGGCALVGCTPGATEPPQHADPGEVDEADQVGLEETDFGNLTWTFRPGGNLPETAQVDLVDGGAVDGTARFELGEVVLAELTSDDRTDAAVQITRLDGNAIDEQWYLWVAGEDGPVQVTLPVARMAHCGTVTHSVTAVGSGGVQIHESRRYIGEDGLACTETGTDERTRVVHAVEARNTGEWWPVQTGPVGGFGGLCPTAADYETVTYEGPLHAAPDASVDGGTGNGRSLEVFGLEPWPVYGEPFPGWVLVGVKQDEVLSCAWAEIP